MSAQVLDYMQHITWPAACVEMVALASIAYLLGKWFS